MGSHWKGYLLGPDLTQFFAYGIMGNDQNSGQIFVQRNVLPISDGDFTPDISDASSSAC